MERSTPKSRLPQPIRAPRNLIASHHLSHLSLNRHPPNILQPIPPIQIRRCHPHIRTLQQLRLKIFSSHHLLRCIHNIIYKPITCGVRFRRIHVLRHVVHGLFWAVIVVATAAFTTVLHYDFGGCAFETFGDVDEFGSDFEGVGEFLEEVAAGGD